MPLPWEWVFKSRRKRDYSIWCCSFFSFFFTVTVFSCKTLCLIQSPFIVPEYSVPDHTQLHAVYQAFVNCTLTTDPINHQRRKIRLASAFLWWPLDHRYLMFPSMVYIYRTQLTMISRSLCLNPNFLMTFM